MARTSRHGNPHEPVTDFSGSRPRVPTAEQREDRYSRLKKTSAVLLLVGVIAFAIGLIGVFTYVGMSSSFGFTTTPLVGILSLVGVVGIFGGGITLFASLIVRIVAAIKQ